MSALEAYRVPITPVDSWGQRGALDSFSLDSAAELQHKAGHFPIHLDLSQAKFIVHDALLFLGAVLSWRRKRDLKTTIGLPSNTSVLHYLKAWQFAEFIDQIDPLALTARSRQLLENVEYTPNKYLRIMFDNRGQQMALLPMASLAITRAALTPNPWMDVDEARSRFLDIRLRAVIARYLGDSAEDDFTAIVTEALLNAVTHPNANMAFTSCQFVRRSRNDNVPLEWYLEICIWDDGASFQDTIKRALRSGNRVKPDQASPNVIRVTIRKTDEPEPAALYTLSGESSITSDLESVLGVAAFLRGVSSLSAHDLSVPRTHTLSAKGLDGAMETNSPRGTGGAGLALLLEAALGGCQGSIIYATDNQRLRITPTEERDVYEAALRLAPNRTWPIDGNLLTVRLPIKSVSTNV